MNTVWSELIQTPEALWRSRRWRFPVGQAAAWRGALRLPESGDIGEVGCGSGGLLSRIAETTKTPRRIIGVDRDTGLLAFAGARLAELGMGDVELTRGDACSLPLRDASLDAVTSYTLFEHLRQPEAFLRECGRAGRSRWRAQVRATRFTAVCRKRRPKWPRKSSGWRPWWSRG